MTDATLRPIAGDIQGVVGQLDAADERALSLVRGLTDAQGCWRAGGDLPSVSECLVRYLDWLVRTVPILEEGVRGVRSGWRARLGTSKSAWWWQFVPRLAEFAPVLPIGTAQVREACIKRPVRTIMADILKYHAEVRRLARVGELKDLRTAQVRLPSLSALKCPLDVALAMVPAMARRHLRRAQRVRLAAGFPRQ